MSQRFIPFTNINILCNTSKLALILALSRFLGRRRAYSEVGSVFFRCLRYLSVQTITTRRRRHLHWALHLSSSTDLRRNQSPSQASVERRFNAERNCSTKIEKCNPLVKTLPLIATLSENYYSWVKHKAIVLLITYFFWVKTYKLALKNSTEADTYRRLCNNTTSFIVP